jgi:hypothetical protein
MRKSMGQSEKQVIYSMHQFTLVKAASTMLATAVFTGGNSYNS